jgi:translation initiation factor RLI1
MLAIARILRTGVRLLVLDEPTEGLAPVIVQRIGEVLKKLKERGMTVLLVEQNFRFASRVADRFLSHGAWPDGGRLPPSANCPSGWTCFIRFWGFNHDDDLRYSDPGISRAVAHRD